MSNFTRKKILMGSQFEISVELPTYGGDIAKVHAVSDMKLARIEDKTGYSLMDAMKVLEESGLVESDIKALEAGVNKESAAEIADKIPLEILTPKLTLFLGELVKAGLVREGDPDCACKGKGCELCLISDQDIEEIKGFSVIALGMAVIGASTASWKAIEDFFSARRVQSGAVSSVSKV